MPALNLRRGVFSGYSSGSYLSPALFDGSSDSSSSGGVDTTALAICLATIVGIPVLFFLFSFCSLRRRVAKTRQGRPRTRKTWSAPKTIVTKRPDRISNNDDLASDLLAEEMRVMEDENARREICAQIEAREAANARGESGGVAEDIEPPPPVYTVGAPSPYYKEDNTWGSSTTQPY